MEFMLAGKCTDTSKLRFPIFASPKLDGVRAAVIAGKLYSRNMKFIPNEHVQANFGQLSLAGMDGELISGSPFAPDCFRKTSGDVMKREGRPDVHFFVFDYYPWGGISFRDRIRKLKELTKHPGIILVEHQVIQNQTALNAYEEKCLDLGYEGVMIRSMDGPYKHGRSTEKEGYLLKLKRFEDAEAVILGFEERLHNGNDKDASGKRTTHKAGKSGLDTLGAIHVRGINGAYENVEFDIGTGFDDRQRAEIWGAQQKHLGRLVKFKYFPSGSKDKPRFPVFLAFRTDMEKSKRLIRKV